MLTNHTNDPTTTCPSPFAAASHTTTDGPRCNADDQKMQDVLDAFKPLATMGRPISIPAGGEVEIIDGEIVDEAEVEAVAGVILDSYGPRLSNVESIAMGMAIEHAEEAQQADERRERIAKLHADEEEGEKLSRRGEVE